MSLAAATRSEVTKQFSTSIWWILAIVLVVYVALGAGAFAFAVSLADDLSKDGLILPMNSAEVIYSLGTSFGYVFALIIGTLSVTNEFRHHTLTVTFLATPRRGVALAAKVTVALLIGLLYGVIALGSAVGPGAAVLGLSGLDTELGETATWMLFGRSLIALALWTVIGVGIGTLLRNQVAAIVTILAFTQFLEPILRTVGALSDGVSAVTSFLPGAASDTLVGASYFALVSPDASSANLEWWGGGVVLIAYAAIFLVLGYFTSWRRDVD